MSTKMHLNNLNIKLQEISGFLLSQKNCLLSSILSTILFNLFSNQVIQILTNIKKENAMKILKMRSSLLNIAETHKKNI
jgi:hypothetical protein